MIVILKQNRQEKFSVFQLKFLYAPDVGHKTNFLINETERIKRTELLGF